MDSAPRDAAEHLLYAGARLGEMLPAIPKQGKKHGSSIGQIFSRRTVTDVCQQRLIYVNTADTTGVTIASIAEQHVFIVDRELEMLQAVGKTLTGIGIEVTCFVHLTTCLERLPSQKCDLLIADLTISEMDGTELVTKAKRVAPWVPVVVITSNGDVPTSVGAIKAGAVHVIEKPLDKDNLVKKVKSILHENTLINASVSKPLTRIQMIVLKLVLDGHGNKHIANLLGLSLRTVETHRACMMDKLGVNNLLDLLKWAAALGLVDAPANGEQDKTAENP